MTNKPEVGKQYRSKLKSSVICEVIEIRKTVIISKIIGKDKIITDGIRNFFTLWRPV